MIRKGMWVVNKDGKVGIAAAVAGAVVEFHQVREDGSTELIVPMPLDEMVQARYQEIPKPRRGALSRKQFAALGYA